jgi:8-oxo-dGTP pyrophosphatase MutT (NUDIX family)
MEKLLVVRGWMVNEKAETLMIRRGETSYGAYEWELPGGKVDGGEKDSEALVREVGEETGLRVRSVGKMLLKHERMITKGKHAGRQFEERIYEVTVKSGQRVNLDDSHMEFGWFSEVSGLNLSEDAAMTVEDLICRVGK